VKVDDKDDDDGKKLTLRLEGRREEVQRVLFGVLSPFSTIIVSIKHFTMLQSTHTIHFMYVVPALIHLQHKTFLSHDYFIKLPVESS